MKKIWQKASVFFLSMTMAAAAVSGTAFAAESGQEFLQASSVQLESAGTAFFAAEDNDELLEAYLDVTLGVSNEPVNAVFGAGSRLSDADQRGYDYLLNRIRLVADGELESTVFALTMADLGLQESYTRETLEQASGISVSTLGTASGGTLTLSEDAQKAFRALLPDLSSVVTALLFDCPYDLYWYNKTADNACNVSYRYSGSSRGGSLTEVGITGITYKFTVADEYALDTYTLDSSKMDAVQAAVENIRSVVEQDAALSDAEKLTDYRNVICDAVTYNSAAAKDRTTPYGNPWQLIWVFDGDPSTNVVCEGYSKAFQYLCDLSEFSSPIVESRMVSGVMNGGTGAGSHMWNLVTMTDGRNYVVDVTNCDEGSVGFPDKLFLAGGTSQGTDDYRIAGVSYTYDADTRSAYTEDQLKISDTYYDPEVIKTLADYSAVDAAIAEAEALDKSLYTEESYQAVKDAVAAVVRGKTADQQAEVDAMAKAINDAIDQLKFKPVAGWQQIGGEWYYIDPETLEVRTGWLKDNGKWYYLDLTTGVRKSGWLKDNGSWFYLDPATGVMQTGWVSTGGTWYYMNTSGRMVTNWQKIGGVWYFFKASGAMAANEWYGTYWFSASGAWTYAPRGSWRKNNTGWWFGDTSGWYAKNETIKINDRYYSFNAAGYWIQ